MTNLELTIVITALAICVIGMATAVPMTISEMLYRRRERLAADDPIDWPHAELITHREPETSQVEEVDTSWLEAEQEKVDTASIAVIVSNYGAEVPSQTERRNDEMRSTAIFPTGTYVDMRNTEANEYVEPSDFIYLIALDNMDGTLSKVRAVKSSGPLSWSAGECVEIHHDQNGYKFGGLHFVIGAVHGDQVIGCHVDDLPTRKVSLSVVK